MALDPHTQSNARESTWPAAQCACPKLHAIIKQEQALSTTILPAPAYTTSGAMWPYLVRNSISHINSLRCPQWITVTRYKQV